MTGYALCLQLEVLSVAELGDRFRPEHLQSLTERRVHVEWLDSSTTAAAGILEAAQFFGLSRLKTLVACMIVGVVLLISAETQLALKVKVPLCGTSKAAVYLHRWFSLLFCTTRIKSIAALRVVIKRLIQNTDNNPLWPCRYRLYPVWSDSISPGVLPQMNWSASRHGGSISPSSVPGCRRWCPNRPATWSIGPRVRRATSTHPVRSLIAPWAAAVKQWFVSFGVFYCMYSSYSPPSHEITLYLFSCRFIRLSLFGPLCFSLQGRDSLAHSSYFGKVIVNYFQYHMVVGFFSSQKEKPKARKDEAFQAWGLGVVVG